ncbi:MAG: hypothetical protein L0211_06735 [Planctomycetaceae bacterium]|nr:hypothetical protein [Planctomycetaceae bacterium]
MRATVCLSLLLALVPLAGCIPVPADLVSKADTSRPVNESAANQTAVPAPAGVTVESAPVADSAAGAPTAKAPKPGRLWVVVKNLKVTSFGIDTDISAEWEVVQGSPEPGASYVLRVSDGNDISPVEHYVDFDINLSQGSGKVIDGVRGGPLGIRGGLYAVVGKKGSFGRDDLVPVSGKARPDGGPSESIAPPAAAETARSTATGPVVEGVAIALSNPRRQSRQIGAPRGGWAVDYQLQGSFFPGERYEWVVEDSSGNRVLIDVTTDVTFPNRPKGGTFAGTPIGLSRLSGQLSMFIERRRIASSPREKGEVVSNTVTLD